MSSTFSKIYIQVVFAVKNRHSLIEASWENELYKYITGGIQQSGQKMLAINGMPDHVHLLIGMKPTCCLSDLRREIKKASTLWINNNKLSPFHFQWQEGFGAFSYCESSLDQIINYIHDQKKHHTKQKFKDEYISLLNKFKINYKEEYLFDWL